MASTRRTWRRSLRAILPTMVATSTPEPTRTFDWPLCYEAERLLGGYVAAFLARHAWARRLAQRMRDETGTEFFEWVDHLVLAPEHADALRAAGLVEENVDAPADTTVFWHPQAMMPRVLLRDRKSVV